MAHSTGWYDAHAHAPDLVGRYEAVDPATLHSWLRGLLPDVPGAVLDIGAGSGRDAAWFSAQGYEVIAVEPSSGMRSEGQRLHPDPRIRWINSTPEGTVYLVFTTTRGMLPAVRAFIDHFAHAFSVMRGRGRLLVPDQNDKVGLPAAGDEART